MTGAANSTYGRIGRSVIKESAKEGGCIGMTETAIICCH
jgi:hypothetical protein